MDINIENINGINVVSSRIIAEQLGKQHNNVIRDLENILSNSENSNLSSLIISSSYKVKGQNREYKEYLLTKDGFTLYMFNIQGYNDFKMAYINEFNKMEQELKISFNFESLTEDERRIFLRNNIKEQNKILFDTAKNCGVNNYGKFNNYGYQGLYDGETAKDIKRRKKIDEKEDILDYMYSTEAAANLFRITQTDERLKIGDITNEDKANEKHYEIGKKVRQTMIDISGIAPEKLPTPEKSIKEIEQKKKKQLESNSKNNKLD